MEQVPAERNRPVRPESKLPVDKALSLKLCKVRITCFEITCFTQQPVQCQQPNRSRLSLVTDRRVGAGNTENERFLWHQRLTSNPCYRELSDISLGRVSKDNSRAGRKHYHFFPFCKGWSYQLPTDAAVTNKANILREHKSKLRLATSVHCLKKADHRENVIYWITKSLYI